MFQLLFETSTNNLSFNQQMSNITEDKIDPRVKRTRKLIIDAFGSLLSEKSFDDLTVQDITDRATINRATFYAHFDDKYLVLDAFIGENIKGIIQSKLSFDAKFNSENLTTLIVTICEYLVGLESYCKSHYKQFEPYIENQIQKNLYDIIYSWLSREEQGKESAEMTATVMSWSIFGAAMKWSQSGKLESPEILAKKLISLLDNGVSPVTREIIP